MAYDGSGATVAGARGTDGACGAKLTGIMPEVARKGFCVQPIATGATRRQATMRRCWAAMVPVPIPGPPRGRWWVGDAGGGGMVGSDRRGNKPDARGPAEDKRQP